MTQDLNSSTTGRIQELSKNVADKIAAGEVVDRPLSIVKELVENALDAGASSIVVEIRNGGKTYIRVTDDGCGIAREDVFLAFKRHATSKIREASDLDQIHTLGFRGEALASISAVSRTELITKPAEEKLGYRLLIEGGEPADQGDTGCPDGTTILVSDLFYNTPARLKFMKKDGTESGLIIDFISKMALAYPKVKLRLINNGNILFSTPGKGEIYANILTIYSRDIGEKLIHVIEQEEGLSLEAYLSPPSQNKTTRKSQIFFVNGRYIVSKVLDRAVEEAYAEKLFEGRYPIVFLFLQVDPNRLDVNIHPNKKEVRFDDERWVREFVARTLRKGLSTDGAVAQIRQENLFSRSSISRERAGEQSGASLSSSSDESTAGDSVQGKEAFKPEQIDIKKLLSQRRQEEERVKTGGGEGLVSESGQPAYQINSQGEGNPASGEMPVSGNSPSGGMTTIGKIPASDSRQSSSSGGIPASDPREFPGSGGIPASGPREFPASGEIPSSGDNSMTSGISILEPDSGEENAAVAKTFALSPAPPAEIPFDIHSLRPTGVIFATYITAVDDKDCFYLIDQHAAHERIFYEQLLAEYNRRERHSQILLTSFVVEVPYSMKDTSQDWTACLNDLGFAMEEFGTRAYRVSEIPMFMSLEEGKDFIGYFLEQADQVQLDPKKLNQIITRSCKSAVKAHDRLAPEEISQLLSDLAKTRNPFSCPHGRPTFIKMTKYQIEKMFQRV